MKEKNNKKIIIAAVIGFAVIVALVAASIAADKKTSSGTWLYEDTVSVKDGQTDVDAHSVEIVVEEDSSCEAIVKWGDKDNIPGCLPLMTIKDESGKVITFVGGDYVDSELKFDLAKGKYIAETEYCLTAEDYVKRVKEIEPDSDIKVESDGSVLGYNNFGEDCNFKNLYSIELKLQSRDTDPVFVLEKIVIGIALLIIGIVALVIIKNKSDNQYDEREILVQGKGYKYGFATMVIYFIIAGVVIEENFLPVMETSVVCVVGVFAGCLVYAGYALWNDAYFPLNRKKGTVFTLFGLIGGANLLLGIMNILNNSMFTDGKLNYHCVNLLCAAVMAIMIVEAAIKLLIDKKTEEE